MEIPPNAPKKRKLSSSQKQIMRQVLATQNESPSPRVREQSSQTRGGARKAEVKTLELKAQYNSAKEMVKTLMDEKHRLQCNLVTESNRVSSTSM